MGTAADEAIDIVIVNYRSSGEVAACLDHLGAWREGSIHLVDNSAEPGEAQALSRLATTRPEVRLTLADRNLGFAAACNLAWARSTARWVLLLNPDARIARGDVLALAQALQAAPRLGAVAPQMHWNVQRSFLIPSATVEGPWNSLRPRLLAASARIARAWATWRVRVERRDASRHGLRACAALSGAVLMLRRAAVDAAGGLFDPRFFMFFEDADLSRRLRRTGWRLGVARDAHAVHGWQHRPDKGPLMATSCHAYFAKHHAAWYRWTQALARLVVPGPRAAFEARCKPLGACASAAEFNQRAGGPVLAFSPSPWLWPALLRPEGSVARGFDDSEWRLLEPASYAVLVRASVGLRWMSFTKSAPPPGAAPAPD